MSKSSKHEDEWGEGGDAPEGSYSFKLRAILGCCGRGTGVDSDDLPGIRSWPSTFLVILRLI
jgi:hypothetical protein